MTTPPVVLVGVPLERSIASMLEADGHAVIEVPTGAKALEWARDVAADVIILDSELPDMSGIDACREVHADSRVGHSVPLLILSPAKPTPEQRVSAVGAGAWDFLHHPGDSAELLLKVQVYIQAKRNLDVALAEASLVDPATGLQSRRGLARRARELGALMARWHGAVACVVFAVDGDPADTKIGSLVVRAARMCDVVGALGPGEYAVFAPATDDAGAVKLAQRFAHVMREAIGGGRLVPGATLRVGYDAVANIRYSPIDPAELLARATAAVRHGKPDPACPWVRRFDAGAPSSHGAELPARPASIGIMADERRANP